MHLYISTTRNTVKLDAGDAAGPLAWLNDTPVVTSCGQSWLCVTNDEGVMALVNVAHIQSIDQAP